MVTALEDLKHEHRLIERVLAVLERATQQLERGEEVAPDTLAQALTFVRGFADGCHHAKEERALFPVLASKNPTIEGGPVRVLTADHEAGRKLMREPATARAANASQIAWAHSGDICGKDSGSSTSSITATSSATMSKC